MASSTDADLVRRLLAEKERRAVSGDLQRWAEVAIKSENESFVPAPCHRLLLDKLAKVASGEIKKLMVFMPSGSAKTTYLSRIFPAWLLANYPGCDIIGASHTADFAQGQVSARVQAVMAEHSGLLGSKPVSENKVHWKTSNGGSYTATGVGGGLLGFRADVAIIDDPFGSFADAQSEVTRQFVYEWFKTTFMTRLKPDGRVVMMHQRLHIDDLAGRLLAEEGDEWEVLFLPAVFEGEDWRGEPIQTDELGRKPGESVWPSYFTDDFLTARRKESAFGWASMYQQRPTPAGGSLFTPRMIARIPEAPPSPVKIVRRWDLAATAAKAGTDPDWTVGVKMQKNQNGTFTILDVVRFRAGPEEVRRRIVETAQADKAAHPDHLVTVSIPQDPGAAGKFLVEELTRALAGHHVESSRETGDKFTRAMPFAAMVNAGQVSMVCTNENGAAVKAYMDELELFPNGKKDDQVDASSGAFARLMDLVKVRRPAVFGRSNHMAR